MTDKKYIIKKLENLENKLFLTFWTAAAVLIVRL